MNTCSIEYPSNCSGIRVLTLEFCRSIYSLNCVSRRDSETWTWKNLLATSCDVMMHMKLETYR